MDQATTDRMLKEGTAMRTKYGRRCLSCRYMLTNTMYLSDGQWVCRKCFESRSDTQAKGKEDVD